MGKNKDIEVLTNLMSKSLRHKIGSIVNENEIYSMKYEKDAEVLMKEAEKILNKWNWSSTDKTIIKNKLTKKLKKELEDKDFIDDRKFGIMDKEIEKALKNFKL
ncbi:hypothetical protein J4221_07020 [Candidatus Pacearchaeota archaeon]|nr:hypothetical protein [Candidatus Pacearchaeota archaeon]